MAAETFRIEIPVTVKDNTDPGLSSAKSKMNAFDKTNQTTQNRLDKMNRTKWKVTVEAVDKVTSVVSNIGTTVRSVAGRAWSFAVSVVDKVTTPVKTMISKLGELLSIGTAVSAVLGGISVADMLSASNTQSTVEKQLQTVLSNVTEVEGVYDRILAKASALQKTTMYGDEAYIAGAAELATYVSDAEALESLMDTLADYAAGMSGGAELSTEEMVNYATQLGKALNGADASFDGLTKKGFAFSEAQKEILKSDLTSDMEKVAVLSEVIGESWGGLAESFASLPQAKITSFKNAWGDMKESVGNKLYPSVGDLFEMLEEKIPGIQELLEGGADGLSGLIEGLIPSISDGIDWAIRKVNELSEKISGIVDSEEFQNADLFGKVSILWDELVAKPFSEWWESDGRQFFVDKAGELGETLGTGISNGLLALLGFDETDAITDGTSIGSAFIDGFKKGFDTEEIGKALEDWANNHKEFVIGVGAVIGFNLITGLAGKINSLTSMFKRNGSSSGSGLGSSTVGTMSVQANLVNLSGDRINDLTNGNGVTSATTSTMTVSANIVYVNGLSASTASSAVQGFGKLLDGGAGNALLGGGSAAGSAALGSGSQLLLPAGEAASSGAVASGIGAAGTAGIVGIGIISGLAQLKLQTDMMTAAASHDLGYDLPGFFEEGGLGDLGLQAIGKFFDSIGEAAEKIPDWAKDAYNNHIEPFFSTTLPGWFGSIKDGVAAIVEPLIPEWAKGLGDTISGWWNSIKNWVSQALNDVSSFLGLDGIFGTGSKSSTTGGGGKFASGGFVSGPQTALVGEEGLEAIIPLSPSRRGRGLDLWETAGRLLGVGEFADGGIVGDETATVSSGGSGITINVNLSPEFTVQGGSGGTNENEVVTVIRSHIREMADDIADELSVRLSRAFSNMPIKGEV